MNLVQASTLFKRSMNIMLAVVVLYIAAKVSAPALAGVYRSINPPKDPPTTKYGLLDPLEFTEKPINGAVQEIVLNTAEGRLPSGFPNKLPVYPYERVPFSYEAGRNAQAHAARLGFTDDELVTDLKGDTFRWRDKETGAILEVQINTNELKLETPLTNKESLFPVGKLTSAQAQEFGKKFLIELGRLDDTQYARERGEVTFGKILNGQLIRAESPFEAHMARVDFFRKVGDYPIVGPDPKKSLISITVSSATSSQLPKLMNYPFIDYHQWTIVNDPSGTYPIISVQDAWRAVSQDKNGVIANITPRDHSVFTTYSPVQVDRILINNVYLAYYDTMDQQSYMQPIYVFEGNYNVGGRPGGEITLYFPAIQGQYIKPLN